MDLQSSKEKRKTKREEESSLMHDFPMEVFQSTAALIEYSI
jgi:hypothetical protein